MSVTWPADSVCRQSGTAARDLRLAGTTGAAIVAPANSVSAAAALPGERTMSS